jgi:Mn-dependent DtxR family transcriptional regulator
MTISGLSGGGNLEKKFEELKNKPLYIELLMAIHDEGMVSTSDLSKTLERSLPTVIIPLRDMENKGILKSTKKGRTRYFSATNRKTVGDFVKSLEVQNRLNESSSRLSHGSVYAEKELRRRLVERLENQCFRNMPSNLKRSYRVDFDLYQPIDSPFSVSDVDKLWPDFVIKTNLRSKAIWVEVKDLSGSNLPSVLGRRINELLGHLTVITRLKGLHQEMKGFDRLLLVLLLPRGKTGLDKWRLIPFLESLTTDELQILVVCDVAQPTDLLNDAFSESIADQIARAVEPKWSR